MRRNHASAPSHHALHKFFLIINICIKQTFISTAIHLHWIGLRHLNRNTLCDKVIYRYIILYIFMYLVSSDWNSPVLHRWWEVIIAIDTRMYVIFASISNNFSKVIIIGQWGIVMRVRPSDESFATVRSQSIRRRYILSRLRCEFRTFDSDMTVFRILCNNDVPSCDTKSSSKSDAKSREVQYSKIMASVHLWHVRR